jgi:uncharacterized protein DUF3592
MFPSLMPTTAPALALELGGLGLAADAIRFLLPAWQSRRWEATRGRIVASQPQSGPAGVPWGRGTALVWDAGVVYEYAVDGAPYRSQRVSFRGHWPTAAGAMRVARRYHVGDKVTVWYDPFDHERSVLEPGAGLANYSQLAAGLVLFGIGLAINPRPLGAA